MNFKFKTYSKSWNSTSAKAKARDGFKCRRCGAKGKKIGGTAQLETHHIKSKNKGGSDNLNNLITLCSRCHSKKHSHIKTKKSNKIFF